MSTHDEPEELRPAERWAHVRTAGRVAELSVQLDAAVTEVNRLMAAAATGGHPGGAADDGPAGDAP